MAIAFQHRTRQPEVLRLVVAPCRFVHAPQGLVNFSRMLPEAGSLVDGQAPTLAFGYAPRVPACC